MQTIREVMTTDVKTVAPAETVQRAAQMMKELNVGAIPVCEGDQLLGMVTDRDIAVRSVAAGQAPGQATVGEIMSKDVRTCSSEQTVADVLSQMGDAQIRRVPVVDGQSGKLVGIVSLGDLATKASAPAEQALDRISSPSAPGHAG
ncbi:CBS domain-containing protein [Massilia yuzhufengensis]|uniref:CBS domain-containing protein n=1 Tax=Massilia yuzhufengensis TaxID=1164594 RepID=A0A1I1HBE1_9BURK|nr:CBS domain-containing protein [Massilia yuzhufengensis]SFC18823.1 CBS domain-containing protein [Massilia yuzhufengensis]